MPGTLQGVEEKYRFEKFISHSRVVQSLWSKTQIKAHNQKFSLV